MQWCQGRLPHELFESIPMSKMTVDLKVGETLAIGLATIRLEQKSGQRARLVIDAEPGTQITTPKAKREAAATARMSVLQTPPEQPHGEHPI